MLVGRSTTEDGNVPQQNPFHLDGGSFEPVEGIGVMPPTLILPHKGAGGWTGLFSLQWESGRV